MNRKQKVAVVVGVVVLGMLYLFPAWHEFAEEGQGLTYFRGQELGRAWFLSPPETEGWKSNTGRTYRTYAGIDWQSQIKETWFTVLLVSVLAAIFGRRAERPIRRRRHMAVPTDRGPT